MHLGFTCQHDQCIHGGGTIEGLRAECQSCEDRPSYCGHCFLKHPEDHVQLLYRYKCQTRTSVSLVLQYALLAHPAGFLYLALFVHKS